MAHREQRVRVSRYEVEITRPAKVLFPADGITKGDLIDYYLRVSPWMLPYLRDRPLAMERYPDGIEKPSFFHKAVPSYYPDWVKTVTVKKVGGTITHVVCNNEAILVYLVYLANQACITPHIWLSRIDKLQYPDQMVFDLDPSREDFESVKSTAQSFSGLLEELELPAYVKTTGSRGLHVAVPLDREEDFDFVRAFARRLAEIVVNEDCRPSTRYRSENRREPASQSRCRSATPSAAPAVAQAKFRDRALTQRSFPQGALRQHHPCIGPQGRRDVSLGRTLKRTAPMLGEATLRVTKLAQLFLPSCVRWPSGGDI